MTRPFKYILIFLCFASLCFARGDYYKGASTVNATDYSQIASNKGYWRMNGTGNETDRSSNGENLTEYPQVYLIPDECTGSNTPENGCTGSGTASGYIPSGWNSGTKGRHPDGTTDSLYHADGGTTDISGADAKLTICFWYRPDTDPTSDEYIVSKYESDLNQRQYVVRFDNSSSAVAFGVSSSGTSATMTTAYSDTDPHADTNPHFWCAVDDDVDLRIYLDGSLDIASPPAHTAGIFNADSTAPFIISGLEEAGGSTARGTFVEVGIWADALTSTQIQDMFTNGIDGGKGAND